MYKFLFISMCLLGASLQAMEPAQPTLTKIPSYLYLYSHPLVEIHSLHVQEDTPQELENLKATLLFVEKNLSKNFLFANEEQFLAMIRLLHNLLCKTEEGAGQFRTIPNFIDKKTTGHEFGSEKFLQHLKAHTPEQLALFASLVKSLQLHEGDFEAASKTWPTALWNFFKEHNQINPEPKDIAPLLKKAYATFCSLQDPLHKAAYIHEEILRIHPFCDGNGRIARLAMNIVLMSSGLLPVIFTNDKEYGLKAIEGIHNLSAFVAYLKHTMDTISTKVAKDLPLVEGSIYNIHKDMKALSAALSQLGLL